MARLTDRFYSLKFPIVILEETEFTTNVILVRRYGENVTSLLSRINPYALTDFVRLNLEYQDYHLKTVENVNFEIPNLDRI